MVLLAWYKLDEDVKDSSKNILDGTNSGVTFVSGKMDNAGQFTRSEGDYITLPNLKSLTAFSITGWIKKDSNPGAIKGILELDNSVASDSISIYDNDDATPKLVFEIEVNGSARTMVRTVGTSLDTWYYFALVWDNPNTYIYIDNEFEDIGAGIGGPVDLSALTSAFIGKLQSASSEWDGQIDNIKFYDHAISENERFADFNGDQYIIDGWPYSKEFRDGDVIQTALFRLRTGEFILSDDSSNTILNRIDNGQDVHIYNNYALVFRGLIENFDFTESKQINVDIIDYSFYLAEDFVTYTATAETASSIVTNLINTYGNNLFSLNIASTTRTYTKTWRAFSPLEIIQELALNESHTYFVTPTRQFNFQPQGYDDLGVTLVDGTTIYDRSFPHDNTKLKNVIVVIGKGATDTAGIKVVVRDTASIDLYGKRVKRIEDTSITTEDTALERADAELARLANPLISGTVLAGRDFTYYAGSIIKITMPQKSWTAKSFLIIEAHHELETPLTELMLAEINVLNSDQLADVLFNQRLTAKNWEDDGIPVTRIERWQEEVSMEMFVYGELQSTIGGRNWNENDWDDNFDWDGIPNEWLPISTLQGVQMVITTVGLNRIRDLFVGKAVNALNNANADIAIGTGTTPATVNDTTLESESYRQASDGPFPQDGTGDGETEHQSSWDDGDFVSGSFSEIGLFDDPSAGAMMGRVVPTSAFSKAENENIRVRTLTRFTQ